MSKIEKAIDFMVRVANNPNHGYDQRYRWGENGDYDCSSLVIIAFEQAGIPVKTNGATYTGNMRPVFLKTGFKDVTSSINLKTGTGLKPGDVLLNIINHTALYIGGGQIVHAKLNEKGTAIGGQPGDQTGSEIRIQGYYNRPWDKVLRFEELPTTIKNIRSEIMSERERKYAEEAINKLAQLGYINDPQRHIKDISKDNWALWVTLLRIGKGE